jgi:hypothetical protein
MKYVFVIDINGKSLMPTNRFGHVRRLLRDGKAVVVKHVPFVIQLRYETTTYVQPLTLGVDAGYEHVGLAVVGKKKEFLAIEDTLRTDVHGNMVTRKTCRRFRRYRKTRSRPIRFDNRASSKREDRYPPSVVSRVAGHLAPIRFVCSIIPIRRIIIENGGFDTQRMQSPGIEGKEYREGPQLGYENVKAYVLARDKHTCQKCHKKNVKLNAHHIIHRADGGTDRPDNLITLCEDCHRKYHAGEIKLNIRKPKLMREPAAMNVMRNLLFRRVKEIAGEGVEVRTTYGYITKYYRQKLGLQKTHDTDAFVIAGNYGAERCCYVYQCRQIRCHNRQLHKMQPSKGGVRKSVNGPRFMRGFRMNDIVRCENKLYCIIARRKSNKFTLKPFDYSNNIDRSGRRIKFVRSTNSFFIYEM